MSIVADSAVAVLTSWEKADLIERKASGNWGVSPDRILQQRYVVAIRNRNTNWSPVDLEHGTAFLVGRISGVVATDDTTVDGRNRIAIEFDAYAEIEIPDAWGKSRNPVWFTTLENLGIDLNELNFVNVSNGSAVATPKLSPPAPTEGLSFAEARRGLAARYGVSPNSVEIILRG
jgi:hypothetical protein